MISVERFELLTDSIFKELAVLKGQIQDLSNKLPFFPIEVPLDVVLENHLQQW